MYRVLCTVYTGAAGSACAEGLRQEGFNGRIIVISDDTHLPYDRPKVSKILNADINNILLRKKEFYEVSPKNGNFRRPSAPVSTVFS